MSCRRLASAVLLLLMMVTGWSPALAQDAADASLPPVGWPCQLAFRSAILAIDAARQTADGAVPAASSEPAPSLDPARLDDSMRHCISVEEWSTAAAAYPDLFAGSDPLELFAARCLDPGAGLAEYTACHAWVLALQPTPNADGETPTSPVVGGVTYVRVPRDLARRIRDEAWNAGRFDIEVPTRRSAPSAVVTRYFTVQGATPVRVTRSLRRRSLPHCGLEAWGCVVRRSPGGGIRRLHIGEGCVASLAALSYRPVVWLPRWKTDAYVHPDFLRWWRAELADTMAHESKHVRIDQAHVRQLYGLVNGPCAGVDRRVRDWFKGVRAAQRDFHAAEAAREPIPLPAIPPGLPASVPE
jgi:hypothetical protein